MNPLPFLSMGADALFPNCLSKSILLSDNKQSTGEKRLFWNTRGESSRPRFAFVSLSNSMYNKS